MCGGEGAGSEGETVVARSWRRLAVSGRWRGVDGGQDGVRERERERETKRRGGEERWRGGVEKWCGVKGE